MLKMTEQTVGRHGENLWRWDHQCYSTGTAWRDPAAVDKLETVVDQIMPRLDAFRVINLNRYCFIFDCKGTATALERSTYSPPLLGYLDPPVPNVNTIASVVVRYCWI